MRNNTFILFAFFFLSFPSFCFSEDICTQIFYQKYNCQTYGGQWGYPSASFAPYPSMTITTPSMVSTSSQVCSFRIYYLYNNGSGWVQGTIKNLNAISSSFISSMPSLASSPIEIPYSDGTSPNYANYLAGCPNNCSIKANQVTYDLKQYDNPDQPPVSGNACYEDCQQSAEILWNDCLAGSCVASVKYTATGESCGTETSVDNLKTDPPDRCTDQINEKIAQCGGTLKVLSFDFESCTGECTPDACGDQWNELVNRCGGIMAISSWDAESCSGSCANDPVPNNEDSDSQAVPENIDSETKTLPDGSKEVTQTSTYNVDGKIITTTVTNYYDPSGNNTGTTRSTSTGGSGNGSGGSGTVPSDQVPSSWYTGVCDLSNIPSCFDYQPVRDAMVDFQNTFLYQVPNMLLECIDQITGKDCTYPPVVSVHLFTKYTSQSTVLDLTPFESTVKVMKFLFSILCFFLTYKAVMHLFK